MKDRIKFLILLTGLQLSSLQAEILIENIYLSFLPYITFAGCFHFTCTKCSKTTFATSLISIFVLTNRISSIEFYFCNHTIFCRSKQYLTANGITHYQFPSSIAVVKIFCYRQIKVHYAYGLLKEELTLTQVIRVIIQSSSSIRKTILVIPLVLFEIQRNILQEAFNKYNAQGIFTKTYVIPYFYIA